MFLLILDQHKWLDQIRFLYLLLITYLRLIHSQKMPSLQIQELQFISVGIVDYFQHFPLHLRFL